MEKTIFSCPVGELSCIIGNLFVELEPPCESNKCDDLIICGTTFSGNRGSLLIGKNICTFFGEPNDIEIIRNNRCLKECKYGRK